MRLTPFPGSAIYENISQHGTFIRDWEKMNILNTVFVPSGLTEEELDRSRNRMLKDFYFRPRIILSKIMALTRNRNLLMPLLKGLMAFIKVTSDRTGSAKFRDAAQ
jgi:anaerobic magnesium-protoporphyrin IX monomethyl ester cyclase